MLILLVTLLPKIARSDTTSGLKTNYGKIVVANLPVGQTISMTQIANAPLLVGNNYEVPVFVTIKPEAPKEPKDGYLPIPDPAWIMVEPNAVTLPAVATYQFDLKVILPDDEKLFGNKYICNLSIMTEGDLAKKGFRYGTSITGLFMFSVAPARNELGLEQALQQPADAAYDIVPPQVVVRGAKPGQKVKIRSEMKKKVELINRSKKEQQFWLSSVDPAEHNYSLISSSRFGGNVNDVTIEPEQFKLGPGGRKALNITVQVPMDADFELSSLAYLVSIASGKRQGVNRFFTIYLSGEKSGQKSKAENNTPQAVTPAAGTK